MRGQQGTEGTVDRRARAAPAPNRAAATARRVAPRVAWTRVLVTAVVLAAVWWPARPAWLGADGTDGFPLSTYPMFGYARAPTSVVETALGVGPDGRWRPLSPGLIVGTTHPKLALSTVRHAIATGRAPGLCEEIAARARRLPRARRPVAIEVVTDTWDTLAAFEPGAAPRRRVVRARCEVGDGR